MNGGKYVRLTKYQRIANEIKDRIISGDYPVNQSLPTQKMLMKEFNTTSVTLQKAISVLAAEGLIVSRQGKGMKVIDPNDGYLKKLENGSNYVGFANQMKESRLDFRNKMISFSVELSNADISKHLHILENTPVYVIKRVRILSDRPFIFETSYIPVERAPGITVEIAQNSIYEFLINDLKISFLHRLKTFRADSPNEEDLNYLECNEKNAIFVIEETNIMSDGLPIEYSISRNKSSKRTYTVIENNLQ